MKKSKVILYNPKAVFFDMPLALLAVGSALDPERYEVVIIDGRVDKNPLQQVLDHAADALCLGITALTGSPLRDALLVTRAAKAKYPQLPIVWGGWHPSLFPKETLLDEPAIDVSVQAQGEATFRELVEHFRDGADLATVNGICYRDAKGAIRQNPGRALEDMNFLPRANYDLINVEAYYKSKKQRQFDYISSAGCRFRCTFCADPHVFNRKWTAIAPERMGEELAYWNKRYPFTDINFQDETFFTKRQRVVQIAEEFIQRDIQSTWAGTMRADQG
ncbi:MAG: cobalamin-dependent protein, partial [Bacteroidota bacterium]